MSTFERRQNSPGRESEAEQELKLDIPDSLRVDARKEILASQGFSEIQMERIQGKVPDLDVGVITIPADGKFGHLAERLLREVVQTHKPVAAKWGIRGDKVLVVDMNDTKDSVVAQCRELAFPAFVKPPK